MNQIEKKGLFAQIVQTNMKENGDVFDLNALMDQLSGGWNGSVINQILFQIGYDFQDDLSAEAVSCRMGMIERLITTGMVSNYEMKNIFWILEGKWDLVPLKLKNIIESYTGYWICGLALQSIPDKALMGAVKESNPEMFKRIQEQSGLSESELCRGAPSNVSSRTIVPSGPRPHLPFAWGCQ